MFSLNNSFYTKYNSEKVNLRQIFKWGRHITISADIRPSNGFEGDLYHSNSAKIIFQRNLPQKNNLRASSEKDCRILDSSIKLLVRSRTQKEKKGNLVEFSGCIESITSCILEQGKTLTSPNSNRWRWALPLVYKYKLKKRGDIMTTGRNQKKKRQNIYKYHPNINLDYFKVIDTKEKAYWLGYLYADGWLSKQQQWLKDGVRFGVSSNIKDEEQIIRFAKTIGFNLVYIYYPKQSNYVKLRLLNKQFTDNLINHGFIIGKMKSKNIELPNLSSRELYLAFLLGYYDGDGKVNSSRITCGSKKFLLQIQELFALKYVIAKKVSGPTPINGRLVHGECYEMGFGKDLFNEMLDNYEFSLPRKRNYL